MEFLKWITFAFWGVIKNSKRVTFIEILRWQKARPDPIFHVRFFGGEADKLGRFVTNTFPQGNVRSTLALPPGSTATSFSTFQLSSGARVFQGTVAPNFGKPGGGIQIFVPNLGNLKQ